MSARDFYDRLAKNYDRRWGYRQPTTTRQAAWLAQVCPLGQVLDLGCGTGRMLPALARAGFRPVGLDVSPGMLAQARGQGDERPLVRAHMGRTLPFASDSFSTIICLHATAIHLTAPGELESMAAETLRVLRPGGALVVELPHPSTYPPVERPAGWREFRPGLSCQRPALHSLIFRLDQDPALCTQVHPIEIADLAPWLGGFRTIHLHPGFRGGRFDSDEGEVMLVCAWKAP